MYKFARQLLLSGVGEGTPPLVRRTVVLSNYLSVILLSINFLLLLLIPQNHNIGAAKEALVAFVLFSFPIWLNHRRNYTLSRIYLSWVPAFLITWFMISGMKQMIPVPISYYDGLRYYLVALGVLPFLLFNRKEFKWLLISMMPTFLILIICDLICSWAGVGQADMGMPDQGYMFTTVRSVIAYLFVCGSCFTLTVLVENTDDANEALMRRVKEQNDRLQLATREELARVNGELKENLKQLKNREFLLNHSQRVARIGSWEYKVRGAEVFWSDEMFNIFGLDRTIDIKTINVRDLFVGNDANVFIEATVQLLRRNSAYDLTLRSRTPFGHIKFIRIYCFPVEEFGNVIGARGICHDVTYYKESEELLRERESNYRSLFDQAFDPIAVFDDKGRILDVNASFCQLMGYTKAEATQMNVVDLLDPFQLAESPISIPDIEAGLILSERRIITKGRTILETEMRSKRIGDRKIMTIINDITEIRRTRKAIEDSETRFRTAFDNSAIGMAIISTNGYFVRVNSELCNITGFKESELMNLGFLDITHPDDATYDVEQFNRTLAGGSPSYKREKRYIHKNGSVIWVNVTVSLVRNSAGDPMYFVTQIENINIRKRAEAELVEAETKFRTLVEQSLVGVYILLDGKYEYVNPSFARILGYDPFEIMGLKTTESLVHPEDRQQVTDNVRARLNFETDSIQYEVRALRKDGTEIWVEAYGSRIPYKGKYAIIGTLIDITDRKRLEKEQALLAAIVSSSDDAIISTTVGGKIATWNPGAEKIFGYKASQVVDRDMDEVIRTSLFHGKLGFGSLILDGKSIQQFEDKWIREDGRELDIELTVSPLRTDTGDIIGTTIVARDITFKAQAEKAIRESEERYRILVDNAIEALVMFDANTGKFLNVSESAVSLFKYSKEKLTTMGPADISPTYQPDGSLSHESAYEKIEEAVRNGKASFLWTHIDSEGKEIPCEVRLIRLPSEDRVLMRGSILDISDRIAREKDLAEANKKIGELKLMALRSVMSPHFVFNVLNSIQYYITKNDRLNAINYLSKFSKLIRSVLTHSVNNKIRLADEIELLKNYIELELTRFENKFSYTIDIDADMDTDSVEIPSLLIQPYVENAILHGLYNKEEPGNLIIRVQEKEELVIFEIEDNGIGRKAAMKLRQEKFPTHKSMGIKITEERLQLINERKNVSLEIEDLEHDGVPAGTRVTIGILC